MVLAELEIETEEQELPSTLTWIPVESTFAARPAVSTATEASRVPPSTARMMKTKTTKSTIEQPVRKLKMAMLAYQEDKKTSPVNITETGKDGVQFPRSMRFVTVRRSRSNVSDDIDSRGVIPQPAARLQVKFPTHKRLRREVNGVRQKLDSCMVKALHEDRHHEMLHRTDVEWFTCCTARGAHHYLFPSSSMWSDQVTAADFVQRLAINLQFIGDH